MLHFGTSQGTGNAADDADPDDDDRSNLIEYAYGTDPLEPDHGAEPVLGISSGIVELHPSVTANPLFMDVVFKVEDSANLTSWTEIATSQKEPDLLNWMVQRPLANRSAAQFRVRVVNPFP